jgi:hypothetical protein
MTEWVEIDSIVALAIKRAIDSDNEWIERELERMVPLWDFYAWGKPALAFHKGKFLGLCMDGVPLGLKAAILLPAERP